MRKKLIFVLLSLFVGFAFVGLIPKAQAAEIIKVRGKKVIVKDSYRELKAKTIYDFVDNKDQVKGQIKILKVRKRKKKAYGVVTSGRARKSYILKERNEFDDFSNDAGVAPVADDKSWSLRGYAGMLTGTELSSSPMSFGGDFIFPLNDRIQLNMGALYWIQSEEYSSHQLIEVSGGGFYNYAISPAIKLEGGARFGMAFYTLTINIGGDLIDGDESPMLVSPFLGVSYILNPSWFLGAEVRKPIYMEDIGTEGMYLLLKLDVLF